MAMNFTPLYARTLLLPQWFGPAAGLVILLMPSLYARGQQSLSGPIGESLGDPIYSESQQVGPSSTLVPGASSLTNPAIHVGVSDPLGSLIETGTMSPYLLGGGFASSYADNFVRNQPLNDPIAALGAGSYQNNHSLMSGASATGFLTARASTSAGTVSAYSNSRMAQNSTFGGSTMRLQFAAGGSFSARQREDPSGFVDPNALAAQMNSMPGTGMPGTLGVAGKGASASTSVPGSGYGSEYASGSVSGSSMAGMSGTSSSMTASSPVGGPAPPMTYPAMGYATLSTTGFQDSTMGTASQGDDPGTSGPFPSLSGRGAAGDSPFRQLSSGSTSFLHPSLRAAASVAPASQPVSMEELTRRARMKAIIENSGSPLPSPFEQHAMQRAYLAQQRRAKSHHTSSIPSIVATP